MNTKSKEHLLLEIHLIGDVLIEELCQPIRNNELVKNLNNSISERKELLKNY